MTSSLDGHAFFYIGRIDIVSDTTRKSVSVAGWNKIDYLFSLSKLFRRRGNHRGQILRLLQSSKTITPNPVIVMPSSRPNNLNIIISITRLSAAR